MNEKVKTQDVENKKKNNSFIYLVLILLIIACCGILYYYVINTNPKDNSNKKDEEMQTIILNKKDLPRIDASLAVQPLFDALLLNFTGKPTEELGIEYTDTQLAYLKLINNETDLIIVTQPTDEILKLASEKGIELETTKVINEGFVFIVNKNNKIDNLTLEQIQKIYSGEITNWNEVGGEDAKIVSFQSPENSESNTEILNLVMKDKNLKTPSDIEKINTMDGIIDVVSDYDNGRYSIGYSYYYYVDTMYKNDNLKYLSVNGVKPNYDTIKDKTYPIITSYYIVTRKNDDNEKVTKLKEALLSKRGQDVASGAGYVPVN